MDFKMEMQDRIDAGMNPDEAYYETRDSHALIWDNRDKFESICCGPNGCDDLEVCSCDSDVNCDCKTPAGEG